MNDELNPGDVWRNHQRRMHTYDVLLQQWKDHGKVGPPPPRPVPPHTPGWNPAVNRTDEETKS